MTPRTASSSGWARTFLAGSTALLALSGVLAWSWAGSNDAPVDTSYPNRAITILVTFPPGGGTDLLARKLGEQLSRRVGQAVIVENRPGASGNIGARAVATAPPEGYTLLMVNSSFAINPGVYRDLPFSPKTDFAPVINVAFVPSVIVVAAASPWHTLGEMMAASAKETVSFASCGNGTPQHLAGEMLRLAGKTALQHVPYRGCGPALIDAVAGQVPMAIVTASSANPFIKNGQLRALAITSPERSALMPGVPTVAEQGYPGYALNQWHGLLAPAHTPDAVIDRLNHELTGIVQDPTMQADLKQLGFDPTASTPRAFKDLVNADIDRFGALAAQLGLKAD